ncbi:MAG: DUF4129 domain-containing protein [Pirellulales bacterium]
MSVCLILTSPAPVWAEVNEDEAVSAGAGALDSWWDYPWYDDQSDDIRRIDLKARRQAPISSAPSGSGISWDLEWLGWLLIAVVMAGVLFMLLRMYWTRTPRGQSSGGAALVGAPVSIDRLEELPVQIEQPVGDLLSAARWASEQGDYDRAIVLLYSHQLLELDKREAIRLTKGKTNRQYLRELRLRPGLAPLLATSMIAFEDVFFGGHSLGRERFEECWRQAVQLLERLSLQEAA